MSGYPCFYAWGCFSATIVFAWAYFAFYIGINVFVCGIALIINPSLIDTKVIWHLP